ncbi:MAG: hypothetical protein U9R51_07445 [Actinomycetota bacterium]|nr:hypothetical protein [Actinomycetota bacterium]
MMRNDDVLDRARNTNPVPRVDTISDELLMEITTVVDGERRYGGNISSKTNQEAVRRAAGRRSWRPTVVFAAAFAITVAALGVVALFAALSSDPHDASDDPAPIATTTLAPVQAEAAPGGSGAVEVVPSASVTIEVEGLAGHLGEGLSGLLQRYDPDADIDPTSGILPENIASFAVEVDADPFSTSQVLRDIDVGPEEYAFAEGWRYLKGEAAIAAGVYRLTVWVGPDYCCFLYTSSPEVPAQRCQMWVTVTGEGQTIHVKELGANGVHCNPDEPLQPLP